MPEYLGAAELRAMLGTRAGVLTKAGDMYADPFTDRYPGYDPAHIGYVFSFRLSPGQTIALVTFVVKGLSETYDAEAQGQARSRAAAATVDAARIPAKNSASARSCVTSTTV